MSLWIWVASLLILTPSVLLLTLYLSKSKHVCNSRLTSHPRKARSEASSNGSSLCQTCHMCGGLRLRSPDAATFDDRLRSPPHFTSADQPPHVRTKLPREHWAATKNEISFSLKQVVQKLLSRQRKQTQGEFLRKLVSLSNFSWQKDVLGSKPMRVVPSTGVSALEGSSVSTDESCLDSQLGGEVTSTTNNAVTSEFAPSSIGKRLGASQADSRIAILGAQGTQETTETDKRSSPVHRLVLEILVSPSRETDGKPQGSCSTSASGLMLKLETNALVEHLVGCSEVLKNKEKHCENSANLPQVMCLSGDVLTKASGTCCEFEEQASQILDERVLVNDAEASCSGKTKSVSNSTVVSADTLNGNKGTDLKDCGQSCHSFSSGLRGEFSKDTSSCGATVKHSSVPGQLRYRIGNHASKSAVSDMVSKSTIDVKEGVAGSELGPVVPLTGLGSLHITLLKRDSREEGSEKGASQVGSLLASLNVSGKPSGGSDMNNPKKEKWNTNSRTSFNFSPKSAVRMDHGTASACEKNPVEREVQSLVQASAEALFDDNYGSSSKKDKKKKRSKGKKLKTKTGPLVADVQEMQEIGKIALEATKHVSAVSEREIGCVCGASKGELHTETCPYPFTSSGSMLQRKIKEQYNHLVRSNAAKTLTLAQVGQFTSCLVEAKATLQQKSESIQRKFTITKSLLSKADKSSFDRLCGQIYGLEMEQKKLEEDTVVYNRLQEQLKLSPAYKKMLEYGRAHFELQPHTGQMIEKLEPEDSEMSFEELLAQEKKDAFWQRHSLARSAVSAS